MQTITGTFVKGQVILDWPVDWPEGAKVKVVPPGLERPPIGLSEEQWSDSPEAIETWLRWYDSLERLEFSPQEEADLAAWRQKVKEYSIAKSVQRIEGLFE